MTLGWVVRAVNIWAALGGGPVCILAIEFSFTEKLAGIPGGGGKVHGLTSGNGWTIFGGPVKGSTGGAVNDLLEVVLQGFLGAL